jgi:hypothetical protein
VLIVLCALQVRKRWQAEADDELCVQLSVEVNGSLVGDSPYLVMFEVDDQPAQDQDDENANFMPTGIVRIPPQLELPICLSAKSQCSCRVSMIDNHLRGIILHVALSCTVRCHVNVLRSTPAPPSAASFGLFGLSCLLSFCTDNMKRQQSYSV